MSTVTLSEHLLSFILTNDPYGIARDVVIGADITAEMMNASDELTGLLHAHGRRSMRWSTARRDPDLIYMAVYELENPPIATSYTTHWAPGLDAAQLEIYLQLRRDGMDPERAQECARELGGAPC